MVGRYWKGIYISGVDKSKRASGTLSVLIILALMIFYGIETAIVVIYEPIDDSDQDVWISTMT